MAECPLNTDSRSRSSSLSRRSILGGAALAILACAFPARAVPASTRQAREWLTEWRQCGGEAVLDGRQIVLFQRMFHNPDAHRFPALRDRATPDLLAEVRTLLEND